jgi:hypothetical protein
MRRLLPSGLVAIAAFALLAITAAGTAIAYFTTMGTGDSAPTVVSAIAKPTIAAATPATGGTVALTWGAVTAPGSGTVTYTVSRNGEKADGTCSSTLSVVSCTDGGLEPGTYTYLVTAKWRSWTAVSSTKAATVTVGPADHLVLSATSLTPTAGAADNLTITAKDAKGGTVTTYVGSHSITFSGAPASPNGAIATVADSSGGAVNFGSATALTFSAGAATVSSTTNGVMKLYRSGAAQIGASDGSISTATPLEVTVAAATAAKFIPTATTATPTAGEADNLTITALDAYGNTATSYTGSKSLTFSGAATVGIYKPTVASSSGTATAFGTATAIAFSAGVATVSSSKNGAMTLYKAEAPSISVTDGTVTTATPLAVTVAPATAAKFVLTATTTTPTAGAADNLTTTAQDTYGNTATSYTGSHSLTFSGPAASPSGEVPTVANSAGTDIPIGSATTINFSAGVAAVSAGKNGEMTLYKSGAVNLKVSDGVLPEATLAVTVAPATAAKFALTAVASTLAAGESDNLTITALDAYGNTATAYAGSKSLTFSGAATVGINKPTVTNNSGTGVAIVFGSATAITFTAGVATVSSAKNGQMRIYAAGKANVTVSDGTISTAAPLEVTVSPLTATKLALTAATTTPTAGEADNLTVTAQDTYGNADPTYTGAKSLTYSGASASPTGNNPTISDSSGADIAFGGATATDFSAGVATVSGGKNGAMKLYKSGSTSLSVTDGTLLTPTPLVVTVAAAAAVKFAFSASATSLVAGGSSNLTTTALDTYGNTATSYTGSHNLTYSGASASPNATAPTVTNNSGSGVATAFGTATATTFTSGVASVSSSKNGLLKLYRAESASVSVSDGTISSTTPIAFTVTPTTATRWAITNINVSAGSLGSTCLFTCTVTGLGNSGTVKAKVAVTDTYGNTVSSLGSGHSAKVTVTTGTGTISGSPLAIPATGAAESATTFTFTSKSSGNFTETITAAVQEGFAYTSATLTATK